VGKSALAGLKGVIRVENGFLNRKEINRVWYNPEKITIEEMEAALKKAGTYIGLFSPPHPEFIH
jgi:aspartate carbamoyltransferase regulatory subunit